MANTFQLTFDCADADRLSQFWASALGYVTQPPPEGFADWPTFLNARGIPIPVAGHISAIVDPAGIGPRVLFLRVPEAKSAKNRLHVDIEAGDQREARVAELVGLGATHVRDVAENGETWSVLIDPEGNEFCLV